MQKLIRLATILSLFIILIFLQGCSASEEEIEAEATHPALAGLSEVDFVPVADFVHVPGSGYNYKISPKGNWISWQIFDEEKRFVFAFAPRDNLNQNRTIYSSEPASFFWGDFDKYVYLRTGGRLIRFDAYNIEAPYKDVTPRGFNKWDIAWTSQFTESRWIITSPDRNPAFKDIYSVNPDGSDKKLIYKNPGNQIDWEIDYAGRWYWRKSRAEEGSTLHELAENPGKDVSKISWKPFLKTDADTKFTIMSHPNEKNEILALSDHERNTVALVRINLDNGEEKILSHRKDVNVTGMFWADTNHFQPSLVWYTGIRIPRALDKWGDRFLEILLGDDRDKIESVDILSHSIDHNHLIVETYSEPKGQQFYLFDMEANTRRLVGVSSLSNRNAPFSKSKVVYVRTPDQSIIPSILTLPQGVKPENLPMVVLVHGGPAQYDSLDPDKDVQFLANRGYAVLRVNFRGSTGYGKKHQQAGFRQFGRRMQSDLIDAVNWAIDEKIADPKAIAIVGASYGGYASLMALAQRGDMFAAGVSIFGPTDIAYQTKNLPFSWQLYKHQVMRYWGDPENPDDVKLMEEYSPINLVDKLDTPLLLMHNKRDQIVGVEQTENLEKMLIERNNPPETLYLENEAHGFVRYDSRIQFMKKLEQFLAKHLGGRTTSDETSTKYSFKFKFAL